METTLKHLPLVPDVILSSDGSADTDDTEPAKESSLRLGETSLSATRANRKMSSAVVTRSNSNRDLLEKRPKIVVPGLEREHSKVGFFPKRNPPAAMRRSSTVTLDPAISDFVVHPPPLRLDAWSETPAAKFKVRGTKYLQDRIKVPSEASAFHLLCVDLVKVNQPIFTGLCSHPNERIQRALAKERETGLRILPDFVFAVNLCVPGKSYYHWVAYFGVDDIQMIKTHETPLGRVANPFFFGPSDEFRSKVFKLIPRIVEGNFVVKKAVGSKPSILGRKLKQYYIQNERFMELIVDIGSDCMAQRIVKLALGYAKTLEVDMMFLLEGVHPSMLPERILGGVRMINIDFKEKDGQRVCPPPPHKT
jgi:hypothetical protein